MAIKANITIDQGTDYTITFNVTDNNGNDIDFTGYTGEAQFRKHYTSNTAYAFDVTVANGAITFLANSVLTSSVSPGRYVYDCVLTDGDGLVSRLVEGIVTVSPSVSH
jgi:hypothetical protein